MPVAEPIDYTDTGAPILAARRVPDPHSRYDMFEAPCYCGATHLHGARDGYRVSCDPIEGPPFYFLREVEP